MEDNFIPIAIILVIVINLAFYFFIKDRKEEKEMRAYFKKDLKRKNQKSHQY